MIRKLPSYLMLSKILPSCTYPKLLICFDATFWPTQNIGIIMVFTSQLLIKCVVRWSIRRVIPNCINPLVVSFQHITSIKIKASMCISTSICKSGFDVLSRFRCNIYSVIWSLYLFHKSVGVVRKHVDNTHLFRVWCNYSVFESNPNERHFLAILHVDRLHYMCSIIHQQQFA